MAYELRPKLSSAAVALSFQTEHESAGKLPRQCADGAVFSQSENRLGTDPGLHERTAGTAGYRPVLDAALQLAATASVQQRADARCGRGKT